MAAMAAVAAVVAAEARRAALVRIGAAIAWLGAGSARAQSGRNEVPVLPRIDDLRVDAARVRRERIPLLLFFSTPGCSFCLEVRRSYLAPRLREADRLLIREIDITSRRTLVDQTGRQSSEAELAARFEVRMGPVVQLVDAALAPLGKPLIGMGAPDFYETYLSAAIDEARSKLLAR